MDSTITMKIIVNDCKGEFDFSYDALEEYAYRTDNIFWTVLPRFDRYWVKRKEGGTVKNSELRADEVMVKVVEDLGERANSERSSLKIIEIPDDVDWVIEERNGYEWVAERHRTWGAPG